MVVRANNFQHNIQFESFHENIIEDFGDNFSFPFFFLHGKILLLFLAMLATL